MTYSAPPEIGPAVLRAFAPSRAFFVGVDSDGCVFDTMALKQRECFCPAFIRSFGLEAVEDPAREVWEFVNLDSRTRGVNRFKALTTALELLELRLAAAGQEFRVPRLPGLAAWLSREARPSNARLEGALRESGDPDLERTLAWSLEANEAVSRIAHRVPPFPSAVSALERMAGAADLMVVSQTPAEVLGREWAESGIGARIRLIAGQEAGGKAECLSLATGGRYGPGRVLLVGDAWGDLEAARSCGALFFPILSGREEASWRVFLEEGLGRFLEGRFAGPYAESLESSFESSLPERSPWEVP